MSRKLYRKRGILTLGIVLAIAIPISLASTVTLTSGTEILQPGNDAVFQVEEEFNTSTLTVYNDSANFGGVNFSVPHTSSVNATINISEFNADAVQNEVVTDFRANATSGDTVTFDFSNLTSRRYYQLYLDGLGLRNITTKENGDYSYTIDYDSQGFKDFTLKALVRDSLDLSTSVSGSPDYKANESYTVSGSADYSISGDAVQNTDVDHLEDGSVLSTQQTDSTGQYSFSLEAPKEAGSHQLNTTISKYGMTDSNTKDITVTSLFIEDPNVTSVATNDRYIDIDDKNALNLSAKVYRNTDGPIESVTYNVYEPGSETPVMEFFKEWSDLENTTERTQTQLWYNTTPRLSDFDIDLGNYTVRFDATSQLDNGTTIHVPLDERPAFNFSVQDFDIELNTDKTSYSSSTDDYVNITGRVIREPTQEAVSNEAVDIKFENKSSGSSFTRTVTTNSTGYFTEDYAFSSEPGVRVLTATSEDERGIDGKTVKEFTVTQMSVDSIGFVPYSETHMYNVTADVSDSRGITDHFCTFTFTDGEGNSNQTTVNVNKDSDDSTKGSCKQPYISYKNNSAWSPTEELTTTVRVENGSDAYAEDSSVRNLPNAKPTVDTFYTSGIQDRYAFDVVATASDPNEDSSELESCNVYYYSEDGTQYQKEGNLDTSYGDADQAECTYEINTSLPGVNEQDDIDVEVGFVDKHGAETVSSRKTGTIEASLSFNVKVATLDGFGHDTTVEFQEPGTSNTVQTLSDSNGEVSGSVPRGYYDIIFHTIGQEMELRNASVLSDKDLDLDIDPDAGNKYDNNLSQQYVREFTFFTASYVGLDYEDAVVRFDYNGHNEEYLKPWVCETWNEEVEYRECRQDQFPFDKLEYQPASTYQLDSSSTTMTITSDELEGAYVAAENKGWREGWFQRNEITVTGGNEPLHDYQVKLSLDTKNRILNDTLDENCGSIRFYDTDQQNQLDYWMEPGTCNTEDTEFWVELPYIPANSDKAIFLYYGDRNLDSKSSGSDTFIQFDEFDGSNLGSGYDASGDYEVSNGVLELASQESSETSVTFRGGTVSAPYRTHARIYREDASEETALSTQIDSSGADALTYYMNQGLLEETYTGASTTGAAPSDSWVEVNQSVTSTTQQANVLPSGDSLSLSAEIPTSSYSPFGVNLTEDSQQISNMKVERWFTTNYADSEPTVANQEDGKQWQLALNGTNRDISVGLDRVVNIDLNSSENPSDISLYINDNLTADADSVEGIFYKEDNLNERRVYSVRGEIEKFDRNITHDIIVGQDDQAPNVSLSGTNRLGTNEINFTYSVKDNYQGSLDCRLNIEGETYATSNIDIPLDDVWYDNNYFHVTDAPHGDNQYSIKCDDQSANSKEKTGSYSQDFKAPDVEINSPYGGQDLWQVRPEVNFTLTDDFDGNIDYEVYYESSPSDSVTGTVSNNTKETITMPTTSNYGAKDIVVNGTDNEGYKGSSSVTIDLYEPEVSLENPPEGNEESRVIHDPSKSGDERTIPGDRYELDGDTANFRFNYTNYAMDSTTCRLMIDGSQETSGTFQTDTVGEFTDIHVNDSITRDWNVECQTSVGSYVSSSTRQISVDTVNPEVAAVRFPQGNETAYAEGLDHKIRVQTSDNLETPATSKVIREAGYCIPDYSVSTSTNANPYLEMNGNDNELVMKENITGNYDNRTVSLDSDKYKIRTGGCFSTTTKQEPSKYATENFGSLEPGQYKFKYWISDELENTYESQDYLYEVIKGDPGLSVGSDNERAGDNTIVQDTSPQIRCSGVTDQVSTELKRNDLVVDSSNDGTTTLKDNSDLPVGTYTYNCSSGETNNFSADYVTRTIDVVESVEDEVDVIVNGNSSIPTLTYGDEPTIESDSRSGTDHVYVEGVNVTQPYTNKFAAGSYDLKANSTGTYRFDTSNDTHTLTVQKATPGMTLSSNASFDVARGVMAELTCQAGSDEAAVNLDRNGTQVASGVTPVSRLVNTSELGTGYYGFNCDIPESENYTSDSISKTMRVYEAPAPTFNDGGSSSDDTSDGGDTWDGGDDGTINDGFDFSGSSVERDVVRGTTVNATCETDEQNVETTLYHDGTEVSSPFVTTYDITADHTLECVSEKTTDYRSVTKTINYDVMNLTETTLYFNGGSENDIIVDQGEDVEIVGGVNYSGTSIRLEDLKLDSTIWRDDDGKANTTRSFDVAGTHTIKAVHPEEDDYFASSDNLSIVVEDITAPGISLQHPQEGEILDYGGGQYSINFDARDYSAYTCNAIVNGSVEESESMDDDDNRAWDGFYFDPSAGSGVYEYKISCNDEFGNQRSTDKVQFRLDDQAPSLTFNDPDTIQTGEPSPELNVTTSDVASREVTVELYKGAELDTSGDNHLQGGTKIGEKTIPEGATDQIQIDPQAPGLYNISFEVTDEVGHDTVYHEARQVNISNDVILMDPESSSTQRYYTSDMTPTLNFTYYSDTAPKDCALEVDGTQQKSWSQLAEDTMASYNTDQLANGKHNWTVTCEDDGATFSNTAEFWVDTQEPGVESTYVSRPSGSSYTGDPITYSIEADEEFEIKNATFTYASELTTTMMDCNEQNVCTTSVKLDSGEHHYNYTLCDQANNCYTTDTSSYTVTSKEDSMNLYLNDQEDNITITDNPVVNLTGEFISPKAGTVYFYVNDSITGRCDRGSGCTIESRFLNNGTYEITAEFYDYEESTTDVDTYWVNAQVPESTISSFGYKINNLPRGNASLRSNPAFSVLANGVKDLRNVLLGERLGEELAAQLKFNFTADIDGSDIDFRADRDLRKSFVHIKRDYSNLQDKTLLVPRKYDTGQVQICPGAESLDQVNASCPSGYNITTGEQVGSVEMEEVNINSQDYYEVSGIQGTGGQEVVEDQWNSEPAGANISNVETFDEYVDNVAPDTLDVEGGNVTHSDLTAKQSTDDWSGIFGNASGNINLGSEGILYSWPADAKLIFAANGTVSWNQLESANLSDVDSYYGLDGTDDANNTFVNETDVELERVTLSNVSSVKTYNGSEVPTWVTGALSDGDNPIFVGKVRNNDSTAFTGDVADYQMMVPVTEDRLVPYSLYMDLK